MWFIFFFSWMNIRNCEWTRRRLNWNWRVDFFCYSAVAPRSMSVLSRPLVYESRMDWWNTLKHWLYFFFCLFFTLWYTVNCCSSMGNWRLFYFTVILIFVMASIKRVCCSSDGSDLCCMFGRVLMGWQSEWMNEFLCSIESVWTRFIMFAIYRGGLGWLKSCWLHGRGVYEWISC